MRKMKAITIKGDEAQAYEALGAWTVRDDPARFVLAVLASRLVIAGDLDPQNWFVP
jgi:hypothetical protein